MRIEEIITKFDQIKENIRLIEENLPPEVEQFLKLGLLKDGIYKRLEYSIELIMDICAIINRDMKLGFPNSESDITSNLVKHHVISSEIEERITGMKALRNILVHRYGRINDLVVYEVLKKHLEDFEEIEKEIMKYVKTKYQRWEDDHQNKLSDPP